MISKRGCRSPMSDKRRDQRRAKARFRVRAQREQNQTERGLELLRRAAGDDQPR